MPPTHTSPCPCCSAPNPRLWMRTRPLSASEPSYTLLRCPACSHVWLDDPPSPQQLAKFYDPVYHQAVTRSGEMGSSRWGRQVEILSRYKTGGAILDLGCSSGGFLSCLKNGNWELAGVEANPEAAERARQLTGGHIVTGDIVSAQLPPNSFDVVTCTDVLEHLYEPRPVFEKAAQWLKPGGIFYIFVPNVFSWEARFFQSFWYGLDLPRHLHFFSDASLKALSRFAGLDTRWIVTPPGNYLEPSVSRILTGLARKATKTDVWIDIGGPANLLWRIPRKCVRMTVEAGFGKLASVCKAAPSFLALFQKPD